jgi:large subunit ribosomal protein L6
MSRIGKNPITIPPKVEITVTEENLVKIKGPNGELSQMVDPLIKVEQEGNTIVLSREGDTGPERSKHGLYRALLQNMVTGVSEGFTTTQEFIGVGYKVDVKGQNIEMALGYSHNIVFQLPEEIKAESVTERGKPPVLIMRSNDKQLLGQVAAKVRSLRKPEPYKGKGIRFRGEVVRKKAGKSGEKK